ncbi:MAG: lysophospholipid acyltransferase family protein, partial [Gordonia sp. (in: high G+C Gram-positive bacteria)]|uniref:lysophospholipid acyltransferase family protein n=1 Tax=Gordonia sp. (in: high G+C Gram-positive bacteria) TaxID=84139 RepID=UPI003BB53FF1
MASDGSLATAPANPWVPVSGCGSSCIPAERDRIGRWRFTGRLAALATVAGLGLLIATAALCCGRRIRSRYCRALSRWMLTAAGLRLDVVDHRPVHARRLRGALVVANHISCLDIPALAALGPARFVAKREVLSMGGLAARPTAAVLRALGVVTHGRGELRSLPGDVHRVAGILDRGRPVVVFPEGTTWCGIASGRFRPAFFQAAIDAGVPVLPVRVRYHRSGTPVTGPGYVGTDSLAD